MPALILTPPVASRALARAVRTADPEKVADARRDLAAAKIARAVAQALSAAPPLTGEQRRALSGLLDGGAA
ncbi:hypothetical protein [Cellulosimicrobium sp. 22601]|uniref:hypothetical protein n=1 Tax=unclassified Cellulosimicrobium TaxID=2624466 RepID=UPI003F842BA1